MFLVFFWKTWEFLKGWENVIYRPKTCVIVRKFIKFPRKSITAAVSGNFLEDLEIHA